MREWMTQDDLCQYLQATPSTITDLIKKNRIPYHMKLGQPRFFKNEIDEWMLSDSSEAIGAEGGNEMYVYRDQPIKNYTLAASKVLIGITALGRLAEFIRKTSEIMLNVDRNYLLRDEFAPFANNFNDYLRLMCQLGLLDNIRQGRITHYFVNDKLKMIGVGATDEKIIELIKDCILDVVRQRKENVPQERHAIYLLWYFLQLKKSGMAPDDAYFNKGHETNAYPMIRFNFTKSLCQFLFDGNLQSELNFLQKWESLL